MGGLCVYPLPQRVSPLLVMGRRGGYPEGICVESLSVSRPPGLNVSGEVECVSLQLSEGDGRVLQVVQQHLDLCHDVM